MRDPVEDVLNKIRKKIYGDLDKTLDVIHKRRDSDDERVSLDASKYLCKLSGLEIDRTEHSGEIKFTPTSFSHEADSIQTAPNVVSKGS